MTFFTSLTEAARKRAAYNRTLRELNTMPRDVMLDLDVYEGDFERMARKAVYGR